MFMMNNSYSSFEEILPIYLIPLSFFILFPSFPILTLAPDFFLSYLKVSITYHLSFTFIYILSSYYKTCNTQLAMYGLLILILESQHFFCLVEWVSFFLIVWEAVQNFFLKSITLEEFHICARDIAAWQTWDAEFYFRHKNIPHLSEKIAQIYWIILFQVCTIQSGCGGALL